MWNLGIVALLEGRLPAGWVGYERRFEVKGSVPERILGAPRWAGQPLEGKTLLLLAEQGLGDTIQFIRYAPVFTAAGARVTVECQPQLIRLCRSLQGVAEWILPPAAEQASPDYQLPLLSVPAVHGTDLSNIPSPGGYLRAGDDAVDSWREWLGQAAPGGRRVGISWAGNPNHRNDRNRSLPPALLSVLGEARRVEWISLQKGVDPPDSLPMRDAGRRIGDFADTAGLISNLDLVISVDTAVAHLTGALGRPVWILLPYAPDWRWMLERTDSPRYKSARLFRQPNPGDWRSVLGEVVQSLNAQP
jgi:hypothetical protein